MTDPMSRIARAAGRPIARGNQRIGIVGAGVLGLALAHYLQNRGHAVEVFEKNAYVGGLACSFDYGQFIWDKFYHVILPQDAHLLDLITELRLAGELKWRRTRTGLYSGGQCYSMSNTREMIGFPLLGWTDKLRMAAATAYAVRLAMPAPLCQITAKDWLIRTFGYSNYTHFWRPLLRAKFGPYADQVAAIAIHATLRRLFGARSGVAKRESMGYVHGGYHTILGALKQKLDAGGARIHLSANIEAIGLAHELESAPALAAAGGATGRIAGASGTHTRGCSMAVSLGGRRTEILEFDKIVFTGPKSQALPIVSSGVARLIDSPPGHNSNGSSRYLGVACLVVVLRRPLTPFYVLNVADERVPLTGVIEMTGLIDAGEETNGLSLVYLPRYVDSQDPFLQADDRTIYRELFDQGLRRLFPHLAASEVVSWHVQRASFVQPLRLATSEAPRVENAVPDADGEVILANTACLACPTLNNNEVVGFAKEVAARLSAHGHGPKISAANVRRAGA